MYILSVFIRIVVLASCEDMVLMLQCKKIKIQHDQCNLIPKANNSYELARFRLKWHHACHTLISLEMYWGLKGFFFFLHR